MNCDCVHNEVCRYRCRIVEAFSGIIEPVFGNLNNKDTRWINVFGVTAEVCRFRTVSGDCIKQKEGKDER